MEYWSGDWRGEACGGVGNPRSIYNGVTETDLGGRRGRGGTGRTWTETWTVFLLQRGSTHPPGGGLSSTGFLHTTILCGSLNLSRYPIPIPRPICIC